MNKLEKYLKPSPVVFNELNHSYCLRNGNKIVPGVTAIIGIKDKPYLKAWASKENYNYMIANAGAVKEALVSGDMEKYEAICFAAKNAYLVKSAKAADSGTIAHDYIDRYVIAKIEGTSIKEIPKPTDENAVSAIRAFFKWEKEHAVEWLCPDTVVGSEQYEFGGKLDAVANVNGILSLIDFKTSNQISEDYFLQTAAYALALEEMGVKVLNRLILRFDKNGKGFETLSVPTPIDFDTETFLHLREVVRWNSYVGSRIKNEQGGIDVDGKQTKKVVNI